MVQNVAVVVTFIAIAPNDSCPGLSTVYDVLEFGSRFAWKLSEPLRAQQNYLAPTSRTAKPYSYVNAHPGDVCGKQRTAKTSLTNAIICFRHPRVAASVPHIWVEGTATTCQTRNSTLAKLQYWPSPRGTHLRH